ncbi:hypothetical protein [Primorskyibacter sp. S87]|uniref:hypothetical protein n=1 Tax=Primorskyibacter sp. S87 TaxID=3415126 RepID=UPI003C7DE0D7
MFSEFVWFLIGILVVGMLSLGYFKKGSGGLIAVAIVIGVLALIFVYTNGYLGEPPK